MIGVEDVTAAMGLEVDAVVIVVVVTAAVIATVVELVANELVV